MVKACSALAMLWLVSFLLPIAGPAQAPPASDWLTWGYDQERSGWNRAETTLSKENVSGLVLQWSAQLPIPPREIALSTLTAPLVVEGVTTSQGRRTLLFVVGSNDTVFAIDADNGKVVWQKSFPEHPHAAPDRHLALLQYPERNPGHRQAERDHLISTRATGSCAA